MKSEALDHPKTEDTAHVLGITRRDMVGLLEMLWQFTAKHAKQGDIGKHSNLAIARAVDWGADPDVLIETLCDTRLLDKDDKYRLLVHDWHDHAPDYVRRWLSRHDLAFLTEVTGQDTVKSRSLSDKSPAHAVGLGTVRVGTKKERTDKVSKALVKLYGEIVKPPAMDSSRRQARKNAAKVLVEVGVPYEDLAQAVTNYAEFCVVQKQKQKFRKNAGNFFGRLVHPLQTSDWIAGRVVFQ